MINRLLVKSLKMVLNSGNFEINHPVEVLSFERKINVVYLLLL